MIDTKWPDDYIKNVIDEASPNFVILENNMVKLIVLLNIYYNYPSCGILE